MSVADGLGADFAFDGGWRDGEFDVPELVNHVAFWMPMLIVVVSVDLHKLFEDGDLASGALDGEAGGVVKVAVHGALVFVVRVLRAKDGGTD